MSIVFLVSFIVGLLLAARIMMFGIERSRADNPAGERSFRLSPAVLSAFTLVFGIVGYTLIRRPTFRVASVLWIAFIAGLVVSIATARAVRRWWTITPEHEVDDERYVLQGHLARVTQAITATRPGQVEFQIDAERRVLTAYGLDGMEVAAGTDVVIERIEDEVAFVEPWAAVEERL
jgi:membrane protein implicated in regulation of membrane protease activity